MKHMACFVVSLISVFFVGNAVCGGWQQATSIEWYVVEGSDAGERIYVKFRDNFNPDICKDNSGYKRIYADTVKGKYLVSSIISAKAAGQTVVPGIDGCDDWNRPIVFGLWVQ